MSQKGKDFGFNPDKKATIIIDENCLGKDIEKPWQSAIEGLNRLNKEGHNIVIITLDEGKIQKFIKDNFTIKDTVETRERKMVDSTVLVEEEVDGILQKVEKKVKTPTFPKIKKEVERVVLLPRIIELKPEAGTPVWKVRYGNIWSMIRGSNYNLIIVESTDDVVCALKDEETINRVVDFTLQTGLGARGKIIPVKKHTDWANVDANFPIVTTDGSLKAPPEAYEEAKKRANEDRKD